MPSPRKARPKTGKPAFNFPVKGGVAHKKVEVVKKAAEASVVADAFGEPDVALDLAPHEVRELEREKQLLQQTVIAEKRELALANFWYFVTRILFPKNWQKHYTEKFHKALCEQLQNLEQGKDLWIIVPRESRKSFIANIAHTLWLIVKDPNIRILLVGAREETVKPFARLIRSAFVEGTPGFETFQEVFPEFIYKEGDGGKFLKQSFQFDCKLKTRTTPDPTFRATYLGVTGAGWRCDLIKYDDAVEARNVTSPEMSLKTLGQMLDLIPLVDTTSDYRNVIGLGTRYKYHDPYGRIIGESSEQNEVDMEMVDRLKERGTQVYVRHALENPNIPCTHCPKHVMEAFPHGAPDMENGLPIIYPIHTRESLQSQYERYMLDPNLGEAMFWHQYMNVCMAPTNQKIKEEWFYPLLTATFPAAKRRVLAVDGAEKDFQKAGVGDYMVALFGEFDDQGRLCVVSGLRSNKWTRDEFNRQIISWCTATNWWPSYVVKEKFGSDSYLSDIQRLFLARGRPVFCHAETRASVREGVGVKKLDWIVTCLQAPMERAEVVWGSNCPRPIVERAKYELTNLGQVAHDDVADTLALFMVPKVRVPYVDQGPKHFKWTPPSMFNYLPEGALGTLQDEWMTGAEPPTRFEHLDLTSAKEKARVKTAFHDFGDNVKWDPPDVERPAFSISEYE